MGGFTHLDSQGEVHMVDVSGKPVLHREAVAGAEIRLKTSTVKAIMEHAVAKGNVLATARIAGIQAAKKTGELIPLCHPLGLTSVDVEFFVPPLSDRVVITATARTEDRTGVEMEALTAAAVAALTIYDMCKAVDKEMVIGELRLLKKTKRGVRRSARG